MVIAMGDRPWLLQDAKAQFSALVDAALSGQPQHVTRRGKAAVVVVSEADFARMNRGSRAAAPGFIDHLLAMPRGSVPTEPTIGARRGPVLRDVEFD